MMKILNKRIMITGSTSGIGKKIFDKLSKNNVVDNFSRYNGYDLSNDKCVDRIMNLTKNYDYIFLNAGIFYEGKANTIKYDNLMQMIKVNALSNIRILNYLYDDILNGNIKVIVTLSTSIGLNGVHQAGYNASKKMLNEYIISMNTEFMHQNKSGRIFRFIPHYIAGTGMTKGIKIDDSINNIINQLIKCIQEDKEVYIPKKTVYQEVFQMYYDDPYKQGIESIKYRLRRNNG